MLIDSHTHLQFDSYDEDVDEVIGRALNNGVAYIINVGRGGIIQEQPLIRALEEKWIAGAGLDVFETEPLPEDSPLWDIDSVIITAHYAGITPHYHERAMEVFLDNLQRYRTGEPLRNIVDRKLGY